MSSKPSEPWHVLDVGSVWVKEFASCLAGIVPVIGWCPDMSWTGMFSEWTRESFFPDPPLQIHRFPLQRAYHRFPFSRFTNLGARQRMRMLQATARESESPLICTTPFYAAVAERWKGPVVYYQTDLTFAYAGVNAKQVNDLDRRLCRAASLVCPNSRRIGDYMVHQAACDPGKIVVIPNATRALNVSSEPLLAPGPLPADIADLPRPILGVVGNLAGNSNWSLLLKAIRSTNDYSWVFVGPANMEIADPLERRARQELLKGGARIRFTGPKPYGELQQYARALDAAILPYRLKEPTYSGSSTRFYEHLAACRPMLSTRGFEELLHKEPLLRLFDTVPELLHQLEILRAQGFRDGIEKARWLASQSETWEVRAASVVSALKDRVAAKGFASS